MERRTARMDLNLQTLSGSCGMEVEEGKVRLEIVYYRRDYKRGPHPGGLVLEQSKHRWAVFLVAVNPNLLDLSLGEVYDEVVGAGFHINIKQEFIRQMKVALMELPSDSTTRTVDGVHSMPELLANLHMQIRPPVVTDVDVIMQREARRSEAARASALRRRAPPSNNSNREEDTAATYPPMLERNNNSSNGEEDGAAKYPMLERIRWADIMKDDGEEEWQCAVCLETCVSDEEEVINLPCRHMYHHRCILGWLPRPCPTCRAPSIPT